MPIHQEKIKTRSYKTMAQGGGGGGWLQPESRGPALSYLSGVTSTVINCLLSPSVNPFQLPSAGRKELRELGNNGKNEIRKLVTHTDCKACGVCLHESTKNSPAQHSCSSSVSFHTPSYPLLSGEGEPTLRAYRNSN